MYVYKGNATVHISGDISGVSEACNKSRLTQHLEIYIFHRDPDIPVPSFIIGTGYFYRPFFRNKKLFFSCITALDKIYY